MQLIGNYQSNLTAFLYEQLLAQLETSISQGEFGGGTLFDTSAAQTIQQEGQNFTSITVPSAGTTAFAEDLNTPLDTLQARYNAISSEIASMQSTVSVLLALLVKESDLIDKTIAAAEVETWAETLPQLTAAQKFLWNFESGHGPVSQAYPASGYQTDPSNSVPYPAPTPDVSYVLNEDLSGDGVIIQGIGAPNIRRQIAVKNISWSFTPSSPVTQFEEIYGDDQTWTYLAALEPNPILTFGAPNINVLLPLGGSVTGIFQASGSVTGGSLPIYVRILFHPRQQQSKVLNLTSGQQIQLSSYNVTADTVAVFTATKVYNLGTDYAVSDAGVLTVIGSGHLVGVSPTILFTEYYPAYQCSVDQTNWSPIFMLDPNRPYPDDTTDFIPINIQGGKFPLSDELGVPLGLFLQMVGTPTAEAMLQITTPGSQTFGESASLTIELERAVYMDGLQLSPFTNFPPTVQSVVAFGFTDNIQSTVLDIPVVLDKAAIIKFRRQLCRKFVINMTQTNYSVKEYIVEAPDSLRRDTLANLQSTLPFSVQRPQPGIPQHFEGAMYEFGLQNISAIDDLPNLPGVFSSGPYLVVGTPEVIRLDTDVTNIPDAQIWIAYNAFNANDQLVASDEFAWSGLPTFYSGEAVDHVDFFVKFVFTEALSIASKLCLQVTTV